MNNPHKETGEFPKGKENYCPRCYFEDEVTVLRVDCKHAKSLEVVLAEKGTPLADFQKVRTDAISEMFGNVGNHGIYPTGIFFAKLDAWVAQALKDARDEAYQAGIRRAQIIATEMNGYDFSVEKETNWIDGYNQALFSLFTALDAELHGNK